MIPSASASASAASAAAAAAAAHFSSLTSLAIDSASSYWFPELTGTS